ncbi:MAG TPA: glycosyltransferase [Mycobacteriales bacterium]|nr:glycosyltransferase [Mycobacteriales bacterium]
MFDTVRAHLVERYDVEVVVSSFHSVGVLPRVKAVLEARRHQGDVTHVVGDVHYLTLLLHRPSTVLTVHDAEFLTRAGGLKAQLYVWWWLRLPVRRAALVTVPSEASRAELLRLVRCDPATVRVVVNPVAERFVPTPAPEHRRPVVLLMGCWPNKNLQRSAAALQGLDVDVVLVGQPSAEQLRALDSLSIVVRERLSDAEVVQAYRHCDLLLFPSTSEGFGVPVLEAQASARPVVTSDRRPMSDVAGGAACLVDPLDVDSIRAGVQRVLADHVYREQLVRGGLDNVARYQPPAVAAAYAAIYDEVLARS